MKKSKKIIFLLVSLLFVTTGCTKQLKNVDGEVVTSKETKQVLVENIICQPEELKEDYEKAIKQKKSNLKKKYEDGDISKKEYKAEISKVLDISKLPKCSEISITEGGYETLWTSVFVKPLAWVMVQLKSLVKNYGLAIILATLMIRLIIFPFMRKSLNQSENLKKAQPELNKIEKKYKDKNDQQSMMLKSQEMMQIYKKYDIKPLSSCLVAFIQVPLFLAFYEALYRLPALYEDKFLGLNMGMTPLAGMELNNWFYLILPVLVGIVTYFSFKMNNSSMMPDQEKQMKMMFNIMIVMIFITSFSMSTAIIIYWIANSIFTILQNLLVKRCNKNVKGK